MRIRSLVAAFTAAVAVVACTDSDDPSPSADDASQVEESADGEDSADDEDSTTAEGELEEDRDLEDPNEQVADGEFRGEGVVMPALKEWSFDEFAYAQGLILASSPDGQQQIAGQAVDNDDLPEEQQVDLDELIEANLTQFPDSPSVDESVEIEGADRAHLLRFDDVASQQEDQPESTVLIVLASTEDGRIGVFNYAAFSEDFDEDSADALLAGVGFDPDSSPPEPMTSPQPAPEQPAPEEAP